jgi:hypothetical protein
MMERTIKECWTLDDVMQARRRLNEIKSKESKPFYERAKLWVDGRSSSPFGGDEQGDMFDKTSGSFGRGDMGLSFSMNTALKSLKDGPLAKRIRCGICGDFPVAPWTTDVSRVLNSLWILLIYFSASIPFADLAWKSTYIGRMPKKMT